MIPTPTTPARRLGSRIMLAVFLVIVLAPLAVTVVDIAGGPDGVKEEATAPTPTFAEPARFPGMFRNYFAQRFGLKTFLVRAHAHLKLDLLASTSHRDVLIGTDDWLFLAGEKTLDYQRSAPLFTDDELDAWVTTLKERQVWLAQLGITYVVVVAPNKHTIYADHLPDALAPHAEKTRLDQLADALAGRAPDVVFVDLRPALRAARQKSRVYYRTDTHWNPVGSWYASEAIAQRIAPLLPIRHSVRSPTPLVETTVESGDLARLLGLQTHWVEEDVWPAGGVPDLADERGAKVTVQTLDVVPRDYVRVQSAHDGPTAVIFRDSYGEALIPWMSPWFSRVVWRWGYDFDRTLVETEKPNVVVQQLVERKLMTVRPDGRMIEGS